MTVVILALIEEQDNSRQVKSCLEACGYEVFLVATFAKALATLLSAKKIDLIVSDVHLENGGSIFDFLRVVKKRENQLSFEIPFVLFSLKPSLRAKYLADAVSTTARCLGAAKYIEMETFDAAQFQEDVIAVLPPALRRADTSKETELAKEVGE